MNLLSEKINKAEEIALRAEKHFEDWDMRPNLFTLKDNDADAPGVPVDYGHGITAIRLDRTYTNSIIYLVEIPAGRGQNTYAHEKTQFIYLIDGDLHNELAGVDIPLRTEIVIPPREIVRFYTEEGAVFLVFIQRKK